MIAIIIIIATSLLTPLLENNKYLIIDCRLSTLKIVELYCYYGTFGWQKESVASKKCLLTSRVVIRYRVVQSFSIPLAALSAK